MAGERLRRMKFLLDLINDCVIIPNLSAAASCFFQWKQTSLLDETLATTKGQQAQRFFLVRR
jgi:hypothetical protein